jgi:hypothetical protein
MTIPTFTGPFTPTETTQLAQAVAEFKSPWQFTKEKRPRSILYSAEQPCWREIHCGGKMARPFSGSSVVLLVERIELLLIGKEALRGTESYAQREADIIQD